MILRPRQETFIERTITALNEHGNTLSVAVTGFGKTVCLSVIAEKFLSDGCRRVLIVAHRDELIIQNSKTFTEMFPKRKISFYTATEKSWRGNVVFSMIQTLQGHLESVPHVDLMIYDEAHHAASNSYRALTDKVRTLNPGVKILGVTATPERSDNRGLKSTFSNVADVVTIAEMVRAGHLVPPRAMVIDIGTQGELNQVKQTAADYDMGEVAKIMDKPVLNQMIVEKWAEVAKDRSSVFFASTVQHAVDVRDAFQEAGYPAEAVHGGLPTQERRSILRAFDKGNVPVIVNPMILTEGWDCPRCACIGLLRPSSHKSTMIQMVGRGLRKTDANRYPGLSKKDCIVIDFGTSLLNHGDLLADVNLTDDYSGNVDEESTMKKCPECETIQPIQTRECPLCGYLFKSQADDKPWDEAAEFRLIEIDILNRSPFRWVDLFRSDRILIANGFDSWACVCSPDGNTWSAIGGLSKERPALLCQSSRAGVISSADDFMRQNESSRSAKKAASWQTDPASDKQAGILYRLGYTPGMLTGMTKGIAAAHITFGFNRKSIERILGV